MHRYQNTPNRDASIVRCIVTLLSPTHPIHPATYLQVHQCFEYEQKRPFLFNDTQMGSDILNFSLSTTGSAVTNLLTEFVLY